MADVEWDHQNRRLAGMGWSDQEQLIAVLDDGKVLIYDFNGKLSRQFQIIDALSTVHVLECHFWGDGVAVITSGSCDN